MNDGWRFRGWPGIACWLIVLACAAVALLREPRAANLAVVTLKLVSLVVALSVPIGTLLAVLIARTNLPLRRTFMAAWCLLLFLPLYVQASAWDAGFGQQGWFTLLAGELTAPWLRGMRAAVWIHACAALPWVMLIVGQALRQVETELEEVALLDASAASTFWQVTLPRCRSAIAAAAIFVAVWTAGEMTVTDIYRIRTYAEELYSNAALTADAVELGISIWPHVAIVSVLAVLAWQGALALAPRSAQAVVKNPRIFELGNFRWLAFAVMLGATLLAVGVPLLNLVYKAGLMFDTSNGASTQFWSWQRFAASTFPDSINPLAWRFAKEYQATLLLGAYVATNAVVLGTLLGWLALEGRKRSKVVASLLATGFALPGPLAGLGVIWMLNRPEPALLPWLYDETLFAPTLTILLRALPIATLVLWSAFRSIDLDQLDAAKADGASWLSMLTLVVLPQRWGAVLIAWLLSFAIAAGDLTSSLLVIPPGQTTIANQIFLLIHAGVHNAEAGLCLGQMAFFGALAAAVLWLLPRDNNDGS